MQPGLTDPLVPPFHPDQSPSRDSGDSPSRQHSQEVQIVLQKANSSQKPSKPVAQPALLRSVHLSSPWVEKSQSAYQPKHHKHLLITDVGMHFDDIHEKDPLLTQAKQKHMHALWRKLDVPVVLLLMAISTALTAALFQLAVHHLMKQLFDGLVLSECPWKIGVGIGLSIVLLLLGVFVAGRLPDVEGSGIPELKSVLAGVSIYRYLSLRTLITKVLSLILATSSGLFIGKEGPFVHISAALANNITKVKLFRRLHHKDAFRKQLLAVAAGIGITATFGTPIGGALYSIEVMATFFQVSHLCKTIGTSLLCGLTLTQLLQWMHLLDIHPVSYGVSQLFSFWALFPYFLLGVLSALVGLLYILMTKRMILLRKSLQRRSTLVGRYIYAFLALCFTLLLTMLYSPMGLFQEQTVGQLLTIPQNSDLLVEAKLSAYYQLVPLMVGRLVLASVSTTSGVPSGVFVPLFIAGGLLGRIYAPFAQQYLSSSHPANAFGLVGAACLVSATTHTVAIIVIAFELSLNMELLYPVLVGVCTAYFISKALTISIYYVILDLKNLAFFPKLLSPQMYQKRARDIMNTSIPFLTEKTTLFELVQILQTLKYQIMSVPLVDSEHHTCLMGSAQTNNIIDYLHKEYRYLQSPKRKSKHILVHSREDLADYNFIPSSQSLDAPQPDYAAQFEQSKHLQTIMDDNLSMSNTNSFVKSMRHHYVTDHVQYNTIVREDMQELLTVPPEHPFWQKRIDLKHPRLNLQQAPFIVHHHTNVAKIHFLFSMLGLQQVYVVDRGILLGTIMVRDFNQDKST